MGTPWTAHNSNIPAYPNVYTPDPGKTHTGSPGVSITQGAGGHGSPRQAVVISGAEISIQPLPQQAGFEHDAPAPAQEGPLSYYPSFSVIDPRHKWQRIRDWASKDSVTAMGEPSGASTSALAGTSSSPPPNAEHIDVSASIDSTLLELELERARASLKAAAASGGGGIASVAAAISAAAAAVQAAGGPSALNAAPAAHSAHRYTSPDLAVMNTPALGGPVAATSSGMARRMSGPIREPSFGGFTGPGSGPPTGGPQTAASGHRPPTAATPPALIGALSQTTPSTGGMAPPTYPPIPTHPQQQHYPRYGGPAPSASTRLDAFQPSVGPMGDVSALLGQPLWATSPSGGISGLTGAGAASAAGLLAQHSGSIGLTGYVQSMQHTQAAFTVERTALEARCRASEDALALAERRHAVEVERLQGRVAALESGLAAERQLCGQLQQQLQTELQRLRTATEAETAARAAEAAARELLAASNQSLELERRRVAEAAHQATEGARDLASRISALEAERAGLEKQLLQDKEHASRLQGQLRDAQRQEQSLMEKLSASEAARQQQEMRLEAAAEQVTAMRNELQLLNAKLAARDKQLLKHVQEVEETQLAALRSDLSALQSRLQQQETMYGTLRASLAAVHQALGPQALAAAFGYSEPLLAGFSADSAAYGSLADRLLSQRAVAEEDAAAVVQRVKELVTQTRTLYMSSERREVALTAEMDQAMATLRQTNADAESRLASYNTALRSTTQQVEELTARLQELRARCSELEASLHEAQQGRQAEWQRCEELQGRLGEVQQELVTLRLKAAELEGAQRELVASREQTGLLQQHITQLQQQVEQLGLMAQHHKQVAENKDDRIRELRTALTSALENTSAAEDQTGALAQEKQRVLDALEAERRRSVQLEAVAHTAEQQLTKVRTEAEATEAAYQVLCQQVLEAAREAAAQAKELQQNGGSPPGSSSQLPHTALAPEQLDRARAESATQLTNLEGVLEGRVTNSGSLPRAGSGANSGGPVNQSLPPAEENIPQACTRLLQTHIQQLLAQQELAARQLATAQRHMVDAARLQSPAPGRPSTRAHVVSPVRRRSSGHGVRLSGVLAAMAEEGGRVEAPSVYELASLVASASQEVVEVLRSAIEREVAATRRQDEMSSQLAEARLEAAQVAVLQGQLAVCEAELQHVKATAHAEFERVHGEVTKAFKAAEQVRDEALMEADARVRAAEQGAVEEVARAEARVRDADAARTAAVAMVTSLQDELANVRSLLDTAREELKTAKAEHAASARRLEDQLRRLGDEATHWQKAAAPRARERLAMMARLRVLRRKRTELRTRLATAQHRALRLGSVAEARRVRIKQGVVKLRQLQIDNVQLSSRLQEVESRAARVDALVSRLEERRITVEQDRKAQTEKATKLAGQLAEANKALDAARRTEGTARKEMERLMREQLEPQQRRTSTLLEELERAAGALQESQANATRLLQQGEALRMELASVKRAAEEESLRAQERLATALRDVTDRDAVIATLRQQITAAQAAAAAAATLLPAISSGQLSDARAVQVHLIGQLGQLQAANAELEAKRSAVETELEVLRVRLSRAEASIGRAATPGTDVLSSHALHTPMAGSAMSPAVQALSRALGDAGGGTPSEVGAIPNITAPSVVRDDGVTSSTTTYGRDQDAALQAAKDQRIHELRAALASVMAERTALQRDLAVARDETSAAASAAERDAAEASAALEAQAARVEELEVARAQALEQVALLERRLRDETAALEKRTRDAERAAADAATRSDERTRQAEKAREQLAQMQALHASAEEAVRGLSAQLRELQSGSSGQVAAVAAEAAQLQVDVDALRQELAAAKDTVAAHEAEIRRLQGVNEATVSQSRALGEQLQALSDDLASARTRISVLQQEVVAQKAEAETLRKANEALQTNLAAAEERHVDCEAQLVEAEAALSRQQVLVRQVQAENERMHEQFSELHQQLQHLTAERRAASAAAAASAAPAVSATASTRDPARASPGPPPQSPKGASPASYISPTRPNPSGESTESAVSGGNRPRRERAVSGALESRLLEVAVAELEAKAESLQRDLVSAETRAKEAEEDIQMLRMDLESTTSRLRTAEVKAADAQARLESAISGSTHGVNALKGRVLELELRLDEQQDREQATQHALARANARSDELQLLLADTERRSEELAHRCEDKELEVGVLQAQLASLSAQRLAQQAEAQHAGEALDAGQATASALELQVREQALLVAALQAEQQAALARAEAAEREAAESRSALDVLRADVAALERQRDAVAREAQAATEAGVRMRDDNSKLVEQIAEVQADLLKAQEARDRAVAQARAVEARLYDERTEAESLRHQLEAINNQGRGMDAQWMTRLADLEQALAAARQQAADAEDAVVEAAAAQVRCSALEKRVGDLEAALADAETRAAGAAEAETRNAGTLVAQREAHRQEVTALQLQAQGLKEKLSLCERQVADRDARLDGVSRQLVTLSSQTEAFEAELRDVRKELRATLQDNGILQRKLASFDQEASYAGRRATQQNDAASVSGFSLSEASHAPQQQLVGMLSENRDLLEKLTATHSKLKQAKAKLAQWEQQLLSKDSEVEYLRAQVSAAGGAVADANKMQAGESVGKYAVVDSLRTELQAYKAALVASQEEAAASAAAAAEAQARCEALSQRLQQEIERRVTKSQASARVMENASPGILEHQFENNDVESTLQTLAQTVRTQKAEIETLSTELQAANVKRTELARQAASLDQRLSESEIRQRDLASTAETLRQQLAVAQQQLESRQALLQHLTAPSQRGKLGAPSTSSTPRSVKWAPDANGGEGMYDTRSSAPTSPMRATHVFHTTVTMAPSSSSPSAGVSTNLSASLSQQQLLAAQQHQQQATKLDRVVAMWRDACRAKDARMQELEADVATFTSQLERARSEVSSLTAKVLEREQALASSQHRFEMEHESLWLQLRAAEQKLEAKAQRLTAVEEEFQQREKELWDTRAQLQAAQRSVSALQSENHSKRDSTAKTAAELAAFMRQAASLQAEVQELQQRSSEARTGAVQVTEQVQQLQEQANCAEGVVSRLAATIRTVLSTSAKTAQTDNLYGLGASAEFIVTVSSRNLSTSLRLLEELVSVLIEEFQRRGTAIAKAEAEAITLQSGIAAREDEVQRLEARLKSAQDNLTVRLEEIARLQTALRRKEADCETIETEISAQIADYQRLKQRLLQQERDSSRLSADQEAMLRRSDELEAALAAKQEECALLVRKCAQLEEQWQAGRNAMTALQERVRSLDAQSEALQRSNHAAALARQDSAATLDAAQNELRTAAQQAATYREQLEMRNGEIKELNAMLQAWEAMRLGKDAQIAALLERCKRHEEDAAEKTRTVDALRRKLQALSGAPGRVSLAGAGVVLGAGESPGGSINTPMAFTQQQQVAQQQQQLSRPNASGVSTRHIHVHMHTPAMVVSPAASGMSATGPNVSR